MKTNYWLEAFLCPPILVLLIGLMSLIGLVGYKLYDDYRGPIFEYMESVSIVSGFYKGCDGTVNDQIGRNRYKVSLKCTFPNGVESWTESSDIHRDDMVTKLTSKMSN